jgi:hypothetical protein
MADHRFPIRTSDIAGFTVQLATELSRQGSPVMTGAIRIGRILGEDTDLRAHRREGPAPEPRTA